MRGTGVVAEPLPTVVPRMEQAPEPELELETPVASSQPGILRMVPPSHARLPKRPPFGYRRKLSVRPHQFDIEPAEAAAIQEAFQLYGGWSSVPGASFAAAPQLAKRSAIRVMRIGRPGVMPPTPEPGGPVSYVRHELSKRG
jgi:hypothetical protein